MNKEFLQKIFDKIAEEQNEALSLIVGCIAAQLDAAHLSRDLQSVCAEWKNQGGGQRVVAASLLRGVLEALDHVIVQQQSDLH